MGTFDELADFRPLAIWDGVVARTVEGDLGTLAVVELDPDSVVAEHSHENEQLAEGRARAYLGQAEPGEEIAASA